MESDEQTDTAGEREERARLRDRDCELDLARQELRRYGERVPVEPQVFDVLAFLVERRGSVAAT